MFALKMWRTFGPAVPACQIVRASGLAGSHPIVDNLQRSSRGKAMRHGWASHSRRFTRNLVLLHTATHQALSDWVTVREKIEARAPDIEARLASNDEPDPEIYRWQVTRPSLVFSPFRLLAYRPPAGTVYAGREMGKVAEWLHMVECGLPIPQTVRLVPGLQLRPEAWGEYVVVKPVKGMRGRDIRLLRTEEVGRRHEELSAGGRQRMLVQRYIEHLNPEHRPTSYRIVTLFGEPILLCEISWHHPLRPLADLAADPDGKIATNGEGIPKRNTCVKIPDVIQLGRRVAAAFPGIPCLGQDIVRSTATGALYVLEANPGGAIWHFSSDLYIRQPQYSEAFAKEMYAQFGALDVVADQLIERVRREAS
jgi:hypothetical protein